MSAPAEGRFGEADLRAQLGHWGIRDAHVTPLRGGATGEVFLVATDRGRFVAKHAYVHRFELEPGLLAAEKVAEAGGLRVAAPLRTDAGEVLVMVEHHGLDHPLALLHWVEGDHFRVDDEARAGELGLVLGRVQRTLAATRAEDLCIRPSSTAFLDYLRSASQDLGEHGWLHARIAAIVEGIDGLLASGTLTTAPGVWDGPECLRAPDGTIGLVDFGNTGWYPVAHVLGYGTTQVRLDRPWAQRRAVERFLEAFVAEHPVTPADLAAVPLFRQATIATYAKFMARRAAAGVLPDEMRPGFANVLAELGPQ